MAPRDFMTLIKTWKVPKFRGVVALLKVTRVGVTLRALFSGPVKARRG
jgi:hypothetical protein